MKEELFKRVERHFFVRFQVTFRDLSFITNEGKRKSEEKSRQKTTRTEMGSESNTHELLNNDRRIGKQ